MSDERANVVVDAGSGPRQLLVCSHLDTTLSGHPERDEVLTGRDEAPADRRHRRRRADRTGPRRGPRAGGSSDRRVPGSGRRTGSLRHVHHSSLLLAAGGTHHRPSDGWRRQSPPQFGTGVRHALAHGLAPDAVVMAKAGPPAILHEEPGSAYVDIELRGRLLPAMSRTDDDGGLLGNLPTVIDAFEQWRADVRRPARCRPGRSRGRDRGDQRRIARQVRRAARRGTLSAYFVLGHGDVAPELAADLARTIGAALPPNGGVVASATVGAWDRAGHTPARRTGRAGRQGGDRAGHVIAGWRGSTDGVVFRSAGIDTVRWGPTITADPDDPRCDRLQLDDLVAAARTYGQIVVRYALTDGGGDRQAGHAREARRSAGIVHGAAAAVW